MTMGKHSQNPASLLLKICYFTILGQGRAADPDQTILLLQLYRLYNLIIDIENGPYIISQSIF